MQPDLPPITFTGEVWLYQGGKASWHFVTMPKAQTEQVRFRAAGITAGWGSVPVKVTIGSTSWKTSVFPDKQTGCFFLPLKADVRMQESIAVGDEIHVSLEVR